MANPEKTLLISSQLAVQSLCDMATRRGLHAARVEAERAWQDVHADDAETKLAAAWQWLFPGHSAERVPLQLAHAAQLPAWVIADGAIGVVTHLPVEGESLRVQWLGESEGRAEAVRALLVPISPGLISDEPMLPVKTRGPASEAIRAAIRDHRPVFLRVGIATVLMNLLAVVSSLFSMQVYDRVVPNAAYSTLWVLASGVFIAYIFDLIFKVVRLKILEASALRLDEALSLYFFEKVMALKLDRRPSRVGTLVAQIRDYESIKSFFTSSTLFILADLPFVLLFIGVIAMIGGHVAWVLVVFAPICLLVGLIAYKPMARLQSEQTDEMARRTGILFEAVSGAETIKSLSGESRFGDVWLRSTRAVGANGEKLRSVTSYSTFATNFFQQLAWMAVIIVGVYAIGEGKLTMGGLIACSILAGRALGNIAQSTQLLLQWHHAKHSLEILNKVLSCPTDDGSDRQANTQSGALDISLAEVSYAYEGAKTPQLVVGNLTIKQGERVIVLGSNGSGKSTLLRLMAGLATPSSGEVKIANLDIQHCRPSWLREVIGYLPQDVRLFSGTLLENLTLGIPMPDEAAIRAAMEQTGLIHSVSRHPLGLGLPIREGGAGLSGGQKQLVGLTRLLLQNPKVLLLDEPTASLDREAEARLQNFIRTLPSDRTLVFTSHRSSWIPMATRVIALQDGQIKVDAPSDKVKAVPASAVPAQAGGKPTGVPSMPRLASNNPTGSLSMATTSATDGLTDRLFARTRPLHIARWNIMLAVFGSVLAGAWLWASFAYLTEQIRAPGKVIVSSRSQVVQAVDGGVLRKLHVKEGDTVTAGDLIAELDTVRFQASSDEVVAKVTGLRASIQRLEAELDGKPLKFPKELNQWPDIVSAQTNLYERRKQLQKEEWDSIQASLRLATEELTSLEKLYETGDASQTEVLRTRRQVNELRATAVNKRNGYRQEAQAELTKNRSELEQAEQQLTQKNEALQSTKLRAPMSGTVKNVRITTLGAVLKSGDELLQIVPSDDPFIIEVKVKPADVGFVRKDLKANVKLDAFDYTIYGSMKGHVTYISPDTLEEEIKTKDEQPAYRVHIQIDEMPRDRAKPIEVIPGMTATAEIITGERTVAQYLLKPLRRVSSEALVER